MKRTECIEYFEADDENTGIQTVTSEYNEYFEEDFKTENKEQIGRSILVNNFCNICQKQYKSKSGLSTHIQSEHKGIKYSCYLCEYNV